MTETNEQPASTTEEVPAAVGPGPVTRRLKGLDREALEKEASRMTTTEIVELAEENEVLEKGTPEENGKGGNKALVKRNKALKRDLERLRVRLEKATGKQTELEHQLQLSQTALEPMAAFKERFDAKVSTAVQEQLSEAIAAGLNDDSRKHLQNNRTLKTKAEELRAKVKQLEEDIQVLSQSQGSEE